MASNKEIRKVVDSMTPDEILELYGEQDAVFINYRIAELNKIYSKKLYPNNGSIKILGSHEYKRNDGLNIELIYLDRGNSYPTNQRLIKWEYFWFNYKGGISAIRILPDRQFGMLKYLYSNHFIERYRGRKLNDITISKPEALKIFLLNNSKRILQKVESTKYPGNGWICTEEGVCFIDVKRDDFIIMKSFLPWEMLNLGQGTVSMQMIQEALQKGFDFKIPEELIEPSDINILEIQN